MSGNMPDFLKRSQQQKRTQQDKASARPSARPAAGSAMPPATLTPDEPDDPTLIIDTLDARPVPAMPTPEASQVPDPAAGAEEPEPAGTQPMLPGMPRDAVPAAVPNPRADIDALNELEQHLYAHRYAEILMGCTGPSIDPPAATKDRGEALALLMQEDQELLCSPQAGALFDRLSSEDDDEFLNDTQRSQVRVLRRDRARLVDVPADEQAAFERLTTEAEAAWRAAKAAGDWASRVRARHGSGLLRPVLRRGQGGGGAASGRGLPQAQAYPPLRGRPLR